MDSSPCPESASPINLPGPSVGPCPSLYPDEPSEQIDLESLHHMQRNHTSTRSLQVVIRSSLSIDERLALGNAAGEFPEARHADLGAAEQPPWKRDGASCARHHRPPTEKDLAFLASRRPESVSVPPPSRTRTRKRRELFPPVVRRRSHRRLRRRCRYRRRPSKRKNSVLADTVHEGREQPDRSATYYAYTTDYHQPPHLPVYHSHLNLSTSSGRRVAARDSRAGEEDWTKRKKQNKTSKAEAEEQKSVRPRAERVEAGLQRRK
ncbi:PREDICTED: uncharacterized protein LOC108686172 [Atta colombica]|uniref:uncharacterized protein LOC108686172 n=1 Tax=Atta colombica TaxID=520822 RepID=UPI00084CDCB0|nr:PREDICTED: uncharacterized protein LOC108686172 [Atta colombica]